MSIVMMLCNPMDFEKLVECSKSSVRQVKGWKGSGTDENFLNGEIDVSRDGFSHMKKTYKKGIKSGKTVVWFSHGVSINGEIKSDPSMPEKMVQHCLSREVGNHTICLLYDAYALILKTRSGLGKTVFYVKR